MRLVTADEPTARLSADLLKVALACEGGGFFVSGRYWANTACPIFSAPDAPRRFVARARYPYPDSCAGKA